MTNTIYTRQHIIKAGATLEACITNASTRYNIKQTNSHRIFHTKESLFSAGEEFEGLYILRSGSAKSFITSLDGDEHITKFFYPGDLLGADGFDEHKYNENILFLETSSVCLVKESDLHNLVKTSDDFRSCLLRSMSHALVKDNSQMMCLNTCSSEQKVARFIIELSEQFHSLGLSCTKLRLSMTRTDIANYMGMAIETVSRILTSFQNKQVLSIKNRQLTILKLDTLYSLASKEQCSNDFCANTYTEKNIGAVY
jgi:CRP/FNR family transcriptional regulator